MAEKIKQIQCQLDQKSKERKEYYNKTVINIDRNCLNKRGISLKYIKYILRKIDKKDRRSFGKGVNKIHKEKVDVYPLIYSWDWKICFNVLNDKIWENVEFALKMLIKYEESFLNDKIVPIYEREVSK